MKYVCKNCNYNFHSEGAEECKFCGMGSVEEETAKELIDRAIEFYQKDQIEINNKIKETPGQIDMVSCC